MKILQITPYYLPHTGGIERYVYNLSQYLIARGHTVDVATANVPESSDTEIVDGITIYRYPLLCTLMKNPIITNLSDLKARLKDYDVIHIHGVYTYAALRTVLFLGKKHRQKVFLTHHGTISNASLLKTCIARVYEQIVIRFMLKRIDHVIVQAKSDKIVFENLGKKSDSVSIVPNGIDTKIFTRPDELKLTEFRNRFGLNKKIILYLAVISKRKGIFDLIYAFSKIDTNQYMLLIVGDGPDKDKAINLAESLGLSNKILFTGKLSFPDLLAAYSTATAYILPSYSEGMPTTIMESLVLGCPVITTNIPSIEYNFSNVVTLIPPGNVDMLAKAISGDGVDKPTVDRLFLQEKYDIENVFRRYNELYQKS